MNILKTPAGEKIYHVYNSLVRDFNTGRCGDNAAVLTLTTLLSLVPLITLIYAALKLMPGMQAIGGDIESWIFNQLVPSRSDEIRDALQRFSNQTSNLTIAGSGMLILASLFMLARVESCFNNIWQVKAVRSGLKSFLRYWAVLSLGPILIGVGVFLTTYITSIRILGSAVEMLGIQSTLLLVTPFFLTIGAFTLVYTAVPSCNVPVRAALLGAFVAASLFEVTKRVFAWFITAFPSYELIYGAFAAVPIFIVWLNLCWLILLFGGVVTRTFSVDVLRTTRIPDLYAGIEVLKLFWRAQKNGVALQEKQVLQKLKFLSRYQWDRLRERLEQHQFLVRTEDESFVLSRALENVSQFEVLELLHWVNPEGDVSESVAAQGIDSDLTQSIYRIEQRLREDDLQGKFTEWC